MPSALQKHALVTGASGFFGRYVARTFARAGWKVSGMGHGNLSPHEASAWGLSSWSRIDISSASVAALIAAEGAPDAVIHAAGPASVRQSWEDPLADFNRSVLATQAILEALRLHAGDCVFVFSSSAAVYGGSWHEPIPETAGTNPISPYGLHKHLAEELCLGAARMHGLKGVVIRYFSLYGPELQKQLLWDTARKLRASARSLRLAGTGGETRDFLHVEDAASLALLSCSHAGKEVLFINGGTGRPTKVRDIVDTVTTAWGARPTLEFSGAVPRGDPEYLVADTSKATQLGFAPRWRLEDGVTAYIEWARRALAD